MCFHCQTVLKQMPHALGSSPPDDTPQRRTVILEGEVDVPRAGTGEVGDFAHHPDILQNRITFQQGAQVSRQVADSEGLRSKEGRLKHQE